MDNIKNSFERVKKDMEYLKNEIELDKKTIDKTRESFFDLCDILNNLNKKISFMEKEIFELKTGTKISKNNESNRSLDNQTDIPTEKEVFKDTSTDLSTDSLSFKAVNPKNLSISTGNWGVQTDRQTDRQTDKLDKKSSYNSTKREGFLEKTGQDDTPFDLANSLLDSLDSLKKEIRLKFKRLTTQEILIFSTIFQLEEEKGYSDYKSVSNKLNLSESSIRDYVSRLIKKDIPINKIKVNNKEIHLSISKNLKKIVGLDTILKLIEI